MCAVGLVASSKPSLLIYVSIWQMRIGRVYYSIEEDGAEVAKAENVPLSQLIAVIKARLSAP